MDKDLLVEAGHELVRRLDDSDVKPRAAVWVNKQDTDVWRLWITPTEDNPDEHAFYRIVSGVISQYRASLHGLDVSDVELIPAEHPAIQGLSKLFRMEGLGSASLTNNTLNGFYLPDGIVLRMNI